VRVLVTGSQGYIGTVLMPALAVEGFDVVGLDTGFYHGCQLYSAAEEPTQVCIHKDVRHIGTNDLCGFDAVVHLAELSNDPLGELNPELTHAINHAGSVRLAAKCKEAGVGRFVYSSSCSVYGSGMEDFVTEKSETRPQTAYARCKVLVERDVASLADEYFSPTFLRNSTAYGASPAMRFDIVLNNLAGLAWTAREIRMTSDGTPWRPLVHVADISRAICCVLRAPKAFVHNEIFNVGATEENYRIREIAAIVASIFPGCEVSLGSPAADNRSYRVSFEKISTQLPGFHCKWTAAAGTQELLDLFSNIGMSEETFRHRSYTRLDQLKHLLEVRSLDDALFWNPRERLPE
jgi:nucleoside-diphosphate-sugar epimerase